MVNNDDPTMTSPSNAVFVTLEPTELIEGAERMPAPGNTDQDGAASNDGDPSYLFMRTEFIEEDENTRLKITQGPLPTEFHEPGATGWKSSFAKLETVLAD